MREKVKNELIYEPMEFIQTEADFKRFLHFLYDRDSEQEQLSDRLGKLLLIVLQELAEYMMISPESFKQVYERAKAKYELQG